MQLYNTDCTLGLRLADIVLETISSTIDEFIDKIFGISICLDSKTRSSKKDNSDSMYRMFMDVVRNFRKGITHNRFYSALMFLRPKGRYLGIPAAKYY